MQAESAPDEVIAQFCAITGADRGRASFFLECHGNDVNKAVDEYFSANQPGQSASGGALGNPAIRQTQPASQSDSEEEGNELYVGGAGKQGGSGQNVIGPGKRGGNKNQNNDEFIKDVFKKAKESGAEEQEASRSTGEASGSKWFGGGSANLNGEQSSQPKSTEEKLVVLRLWKNGFSVDDGELREFDKPENKKFMKDIMEGHIPQELSAMGGKINLDMEDHRDEDYKPPPKPAYTAFSGSGNAMGASTSTRSVPSVASECTDFELNLDSGAPTTRLQIRLLDGSRVVQQFNTSHSVSDLRKFVAQKSGRSTSDFKLMRMRPNELIQDDSLTLEGAKLLNVAIVQQ